jgi:adhesin transport system outer membrane protein
MSAMLAAFFMPAAALADSSHTLQQIVEKTVTSNPEVQARYHNFTAAEQETLVTRGRLLPQLDLTSTYRDQEKMVPDPGNTGIPENRTALVLRQLLFDGFITSNEMNRLSHASRVRFYELQSTMQKVGLEATRAYLDIQRYRQLSDYAKDNYVTHKQFYDRIEERVLAGVGRRVDLEQASGRLALAEANLLTELTNLHDATANYQRLVGELPPDTLPEIDLAALGVSNTAVEALDLAYKQNPDLLAAIENIVATENEVKSKRGSYMPRLDLQATKVLDTSSDGRNSAQAADVLELTLNFNLFNGLSDRSAISQAAEKLISTHDLRDKACIDTRQTVAIAYNDIERLREQLVYRDQHQLSIEKAREAYRRQFDIGQRTLLDLLDTENEYFQARRAYANTEYDLEAAFARTYAGQGELLNKLGVVRAGLPDYGRAEYFDRQNVCQAVAPSMPKVDKKELLERAKPLSDSMKPPALKVPPEKIPPLSQESAVHARVEGWGKAWESRNLDAYLSYYAEKFTPSYGMSKAEWLKQRTYRIRTPDTIKLGLKNIKVTVNGDKAVANVQMPQEALADFGQEYENSKGYKDEVRKELGFELIEGSWQIVRESVVDCVNGPCQWQIKKFGDAVVAVTPVDNAAPAASDVKTALNQWKSGWEQHDYHAYVAIYSDNFTPQKFSDRQAWLEDRKEKLEKAGKLKLSLNDVRIEENTDKAIVRFKQTYQTSSYSLKANKELHMQKTDGNWRIVQEIVN